MSYTTFAPANRAAAYPGTIVSKSTAWTTSGLREATRRKAYHHHRGIRGSQVCGREGRVRHLRLLRRDGDRRCPAANSPRAHDVGEGDDRQGGPRDPPRPAS